METITLSLTYIHRNFDDVMARIINREVIIHIKYKGKISAILQPYNI